jgi:hypothetical protein
MTEPVPVIHVFSYCSETWMAWPSHAMTMSPLVRPQKIRLLASISNNVILNNLKSPSAVALLNQNTIGHNLPDHRNRRCPAP